MSVRFYFYFFYPRGEICEKITRRDFYGNFFSGIARAFNNFGCTCGKCESLVNFQPFAIPLRYWPKKWSSFTLLVICPHLTTHLTSCQKIHMAGNSIHKTINFVVFLSRVCTIGNLFYVLMFVIRAWSYLQIIEKENYRNVN